MANNMLLNEYENIGNYNDYYLDQRMPFPRPIDTLNTPGIGKILLVVWLGICLIGLGIMFYLKLKIVGALVIALPTFIGMVLNPTFGVCVFMLALPTADGIAIPGMFSMGRGLGIALALSFFLNILITRPQLPIRHKSIWIIFILAFVIGLNIPRGGNMKLEFIRFFSLVQLLILFLIVYWVILCNGRIAVKWILRSYLAGTVIMFLITLRTGIRYLSSDTEARFSATLGGEINPNFLSGMVVMAIFCAIYLFISDWKLYMKIIYGTCVPFLLLILLKIGSRGAFVALGVTLISPVFFIRDFAKNPKILILVISIIFIFGGLIIYTFASGMIGGETAERLTDIDYAKQSIGVRMHYIKTAISAALKNPLGTTYTYWFTKTGLDHYPHSDFFFMLGLYGFLGAGLFAAFVISMLLTIKRMPLCTEKIFARAVLTYLLIVGFNNVFMFHKFYFAFMGVILAFFYLQKKESLVNANYFNNY